MDLFENLCVRPGVFYLPGEKENMEAWAVVACDQYTAQKNVWQSAYEYVGERPSALKLIIPEAYLDESDRRVPQAQAEMARYLSAGVLREAVSGMVLVRRVTQSGARLGLVLTVDLEAYSFAGKKLVPFCISGGNDTKAACARLCMWKIRLFPTGTG